MRSPGPGEASPTLSTRSDFEGILEGLWNDPRRFHRPAHEVLADLLSFGGRLPLGDGADALAELDRRLWEALASRPEIVLSPEPPSRGTVLEAFSNELGRVHLRPAGLPRPDYGPRAGPHTHGWIAVPPELYREARAAADAALAEEAALRTRCDALFASDPELADPDRVLDAVDDAVRHVEAVMLYLDDELLALIERHKTLIDSNGRPGLCSRLRGRNPCSWTSGERLAVVALRALFLSGRSIRFEEFNGKELTARRLLAKLSELARAYEPFGLELPAADAGPLALAASIGRAAQRAIGQPRLRYRYVNGLTFFKAERWTRVADTPDLPLPARVLALHEAWLGRPPEGTPEEVFDRLAEAAVYGRVELPDEAFSGRAATTPVELLMEEMVVAVLFAAGADYSMSSSLRDLRWLTVADRAARLEGIVDLEPRPHFFCAVASRPGLAAELGERLAPHVYHAVQARMEFNRWHFIPGNFPESEVPRTRHYYYPPVMPDLAEWSDQRHSGHKRGGVRYSIRTPGPDMGEPPLTLAGQAYRGFYDLRAVRMEGSPFNVAEMLAVRRLRVWLGLLWRRIFERSEAEPGSVVIRGFVTGRGYEPAGEEA